MKKGLVILGIVIFVTIISLSLVHAEDEVTVYLKTPIVWYTPSGVRKTTSEIKLINPRFGDRFYRGEPIASIKYGEYIWIPFSNIQLIVKGDSYFIKRKPMEEE